MKVPGLILGLLLSWFAEAQQQYYGTPVSSLTITGFESQADLQVVPIHVGDILTPANVRAAIQALYNTGHYSSIEADVNPADGGTTSLTFQVKPIFFFSTFSLVPEDLLDRSLSNYVRLPFGEKFTQSAVDRVVQQTSDLLMAEGYFQATIQPQYDFDADTHLVTVTLNAVPGQKAKIGSILIEGGEQTFTEPELLDAFGLKTGKEFSGAAVDKGLLDLRARFTELRFLNTRVTSDRMHDPTTNTIDLHITIQPGQFALVQPRGFDIGRKKLRELVPIYEEAAVDPDLVEEGRVRITQYMQQEGYFDAEVTSEFIEVDPALGNAIQINYVITPGVKHEILDVRIEGNRAFTTDEIRRRIKTRKAELLSHGVFSADTLEQDRRIIEAMYRTAGFEGTAVMTMAEDVDHAITVLFRIEEGKRLTIDGIDIAGNDRIPTQELQDVLLLMKGETYTPSAVDDARAALTQLYYSRGYADARVDRMISRVDGTDGVRITFQITEGQPYLVGSIIVAGNRHTKDKVVRRDSRLQEYKPLNPEAILEAQQRLYATGLFSRVEIITLDQGIPGIRNILIQIEDAKPILLTYGVGYQDFEQVRGTFEITHNNLFGLHRAFTFRARGSRREQLVQGTYREPRLFNHELDGFISTLLEHVERPFFSASRIDFSLQVLKRLSVQDSILTTSSWQTVNIGDIRVNPHAPSVGPNDTQLGPCQICQIGRIGTTVIRDRRNDPLNPSTGIFTTATLQVASSAFGSELNFTAFYNQTSFYRPFRNGVVATAFRFGWNHPFGSTAQFAPGQAQQLPPTERYWAGGSTTLRGLSLDDARPSSFPNMVGGNVMTIGNIEYRFPLKAPIRNLGGALFYDTGNVFPRLDAIRLQEFTNSLGFGFRYQTPFGPVRLDFGFNLHPQIRPDETQQPRLKVFFTLGNPF